MPKFTARVNIHTDTLDNALTVLCERLGYDEDYGFFYRVDFDLVESADEFVVIDT